MRLHLPISTVRYFFQGFFRVGAKLCGEWPSRINVPHPCSRWNPGVINLSNYIQVFGKTLQKHDEALRNIPETKRKKNLTLLYRHATSADVPSRMSHINIQFISLWCHIHRVFHFFLRFVFDVFDLFDRTVVRQGSEVGEREWVGIWIRFCELGLEHGTLEAQRKLNVDVLPMRCFIFKFYESFKCSNYLSCYTCKQMTAC